GNLQPLARRRDECLPPRGVLIATRIGAAVIPDLMVVFVIANQFLNYFREPRCPLPCLFAGFQQIVQPVVLGDFVGLVPVVLAHSGHRRVKRSTSRTLMPIAASREPSPAGATAMPNSNAAMITAPVAT